MAEAVPFVRPASRTIRNYDTLWGLPQKDLRSKFGFAKLHKEPVLVDHMIQIALVKWETRAAWRPLLIGGIYFDKTGKMFISKFTEFPVFNVKIMSKGIRITNLGISGYPLYHLPQGRIYGRMNPIDGSEFQIFSQHDEIS